MFNGLDFLVLQQRYQTNDLTQSWYFLGIELDKSKKEIFFLFLFF